MKAIISKHYFVRDAPHSINMMCSVRSGPPEILTEPAARGTRERWPDGHAAQRREPVKKLCVGPRVAQQVEVPQPVADPAARRGDGDPASSAARHRAQRRESPPPSCRRSSPHHNEAMVLHSDWKDDDSGLQHGQSRWRLHSTPWVFCLASLGPQCALNGMNTPTVSMGLRGACHATTQRSRRSG